MLKRLHFENWRSLRDVTIDLAPITVFIGANSSGKTNILEALHFLRYAATEGTREAVVRAWRNGDKIRTVGIDPTQAIVFETSYSLEPNNGLLTDTMTLKFAQSDRILAVDHSLKQDETVLVSSTNDNVFDATPRVLGEPRWFVIPDEDLYQQQRSIIDRASFYVSQRWQLLRENFTPPSAFSSEMSSSYMIDSLAVNVPLVLDFMRRTFPVLYDNLQFDLRGLIEYVDRLETESSDRGTRFLVTEKSFRGQEAPTVSAGTSRIIAMLAAYYALDMSSPELPGLVAIEEPDTAVHPLLLRKLVELLRSYTDDEEHPRQFILTTHNPMLLNLFTPDEVRIVERDENGFTTVRGIDENVAKTWFEYEGAYNLGNLWTTRLMGGVPE